MSWALRDMVQEDFERFKVFDAHFHIVDPRFTLIPNNGYLPSAFSCGQYLEAVRGCNFVGGAVVSGSFQGFDYSYLLDALSRLPGQYVGVPQLPVSIEDQEILALDGAGIRGVRFNLKRGGSEGLEHLETMAKRVHEMAGWHVELYVDSRELEELYPILLRLPAFSVDHLGLSYEGFHTLLSLVEKGAKVKATGFGRLDLDVPRAIREIVSVNPDSLMFGTDLPSTRAPRPYTHNDLLMLVDILEDEVLINRVLYENAVEFYSPPTTPTCRNC